MIDAELYQVALWLGRAYTTLLFFYGIILLAKEKSWVMWLLFILGAASYTAYTILASLGQTPTPTPYRLLSTYGGALCIHILLLVIRDLRHKARFAAGAFDGPYGTHA